MFIKCKCKNIEKNVSLLKTYIQHKNENVNAIWLFNGHITNSIMNQHKCTLQKNTQKTCVTNYTHFIAKLHVC